MQHDVKELKRANEILLAASSVFAQELDPATAVVTEFIDSHKERFGIEPICTVLREHGVQIVRRRITRRGSVRVRCVTRAVAFVTNGGITPMPRFDAYLSPAQIEQVVAYMLKL